MYLKEMDMKELSSQYRVPVFYFLLGLLVPKEMVY